MQPVSKTINLYVAGCYYDDRIPTLIEELCAIPGVAVPYNWTRYIKQEEGGEKRLPADSAIFDITGVEQCDMLVVVMDMYDYAYRGTFTELGAALALEKPILMMIDKGDGANNNTEPQYASSNCFFHHPAILHVHHLDQIKRVINALAQPEPLKLMVLGAGGHGKDTVAEALRDSSGISFASSSEVCNEMAVFPVLKDRYGYQSEQECFDDRRNHREEWYQLIREFNAVDKARLCKHVLEKSDMYVGMRDYEEFVASRPLVNLVIAVDATDRLSKDCGGGGGAVDTTMKIPLECADIRVYNNGTLEHLKQKVGVVASLLRLHRRVHCQREHVMRMTFEYYDFDGVKLDGGLQKVYM